jgi:hypothetical protein
VNAASKGHVDIVLFLLERANPLIKNKFGETAYDVAAAAGETHLCQVLESHEALWQTMDPLSFHVTIPVVLSQVQVGTDQHFDHDVWFHQSKSIPGKQKVALPNTEWFWLTGWSIDGTFPCTAADGWSYAKQGDDHWYAEMPAKPAGWVRKRRWMRIMKKRMDLLMDNQVMEEDASSEHEEDNHRLSTVSTTMARATFISSSQSQQLLQEQINEVPLMSRPSSDEEEDEDEDVQAQHMNGTWENNELALDCRQCHRVFNLIIRKHHCR